MDQPKRSKGEQTRELLIEAAFRQFTAHGFHGASMRQIAEDVGLAVGGIYNHFANKDEMLKAVLIKYHPVNVMAAELAVAKGATVETLLRDAARRFASAVQSQPGLVKLLFIEMVECQGRHLPELLQTLFPQVLAFVDELNRLEGATSAKPPLVTFRILVSLLVGYFVSESLLAHGPAILQQTGMVDDFVDVLLYGLLSEQAAQKSPYLDIE
jgi:AcrR family transcriptional regulator